MFPVLALCINLPATATTPPPPALNAAYLATLISEYCHGEPKARKTVEQYCATSDCDRNVIQNTQNICASLGTNANFSSPRIPELQARPTENLASPKPAAAVLSVALINSYCRGGAAEKLLLQQHCSHNDCGEDSLENICANLGTSVDPRELLTSAPIPTPPPQPVITQPATNIPSQLAALFLNFCQGDAAAVAYIQQYCANNSCDQTQRAQLEGFCSNKGISVDVTAILEPGISKPSSNRSINGKALFELVSSYCDGNSMARTAIQKHCASSGCSSGTLSHIQKTCADQGKIVDSQELAAAPELPTTPTTPTEAGPGGAVEEKPRPTGILRSLEITWSIPSQRMDGKLLSSSEFAGVAIYLTSEESGENRSIRVENPLATSYTLNNLPPDTYHIALVGIDYEGRFSELSEVLSLTIPPSEA